MKKYLLLSLLCFSQGLFAAMPECFSTYGGFCQYTGKVARIYINSSNLILMYFDTVIPVENANEASITISNGNAGAILISDNLDFAKLFYSTALAAQVSGRQVTVQMYGDQSGYLKIDRIWLNE